jgi:AcrR family transcriptional regulator
MSSSLRKKSVRTSLIGLMGERPLSRQESQARTRNRLVEEAERVFLKKGFLAASIGEIAQAAGFTTGAVYSNFSSKEDLGLAVIERRMLGSIGDLREMLATTRPTVRARLAVLDAWASDALDDEDWVVLITEFILAMRHKPDIRKRYANGLRAATVLIADIVERQRDDLGITLSMEPARLAPTLLGLGMGLSVLRVADPQLDPGTFAEVSGLLLGPVPASAT